MAFAPPLQAATVLGAMANMTANRITSAEDLRGQGYAILVGRPHPASPRFDVACDALARRTPSGLAVVAACRLSRPICSPQPAPSRELGMAAPGD